MDGINKPPQITTPPTSSEAGKAPTGDDVKIQSATGIKLSDNPLLARRATARKGLPKLKAFATPSKLQSQEMRLAGRLFDYISSKKIDNALAQPVKHGKFAIYPIGSEGLQLYAHSGIHDVTGGESLWAASELAGTNKIIALETILASEYTPKSAGSEINYGKYKVKATSVSSLPDMGQLASSYTSDAKDAKSVQVQVTNTETGATRDVTVDLLQLWEDGKGISPDLAKGILERIPLDKCQIHCRAGLGRTGTLIVMKQMEQAFEKGILTKENVVNFIADSVANGRGQRANGQFVQTKEQVQSLIDFAKDLTGVTESSIEKQLS